MTEELTYCYQEIERYKNRIIFLEADRRVLQNDVARYMTEANELRGMLADHTITKTKLIEAENALDAKNNNDVLKTIIIGKISDHFDKVTDI